MCALDRFHPSRGVLDFSLLGEIAAGLSFFDEVHVGWCGEPLMHPRFAEAAALLKRAGPRLVVTTNGTLLDPGTADALVDARLDVLNVSIDGSTPERYSRIRRGGDLRAVLSNVRTYLARRKPGQCVNMISTVHAENVDDMEDLARLARDTGFDAMAFNFAVPHFSEIVSSDSGTFDAARAVGRAREAAGAFADRVVAPSFSASRGCAYLTPAITPEGDLVPCAMMLFERDTFYRGRAVRVARRSFGNVGAVPLLRIIESPDYLAFVGTARASSADSCGPCALNAGCFCP